MRTLSFAWMSSDLISNGSSWFTGTSLCIDVSYDGPALITTWYFAASAMLQSNYAEQLQSSELHGRQCRKYVMATNLQACNVMSPANM